MGGALFADRALLPGGWANDVLLRWDAHGRLTEVRPQAQRPPQAERAAGPVLPGMPNLHSHAFQRAFAGLTQYRGAGVQAGADDFWTWRHAMYRVANALTPPQMQAIATHAYVEMLRAGYTSVCEFHYLHHQPDGNAYADPGEMSVRLVAAAADAGIGLTLLPVLYRHRGFGAQPPEPAQRRFLNTPERLLAIVDRVVSAHPENIALRYGAAAHSLRAVAPPDLEQLLAGLAAQRASAPMHIHIAEQQREVDDSIAWSGARPVRWLLDHFAVDARWCLVHATHVDAGERAALARSGAVAGLCPSTEADLGDGAFDTAAWLADGGRWGIGSDSHVTIDAAGELRLLEQVARLAARKRNVLATSATAPATLLWTQAVAGGAQASGRAIAGLAAGQSADFVVLDGAASAGLPPDQALALAVLSRHPGERISEVRVGGAVRVRDDRHIAQRRAQQAFDEARTALLAAI